MCRATLLVACALLGTAAPASAMTDAYLLVRTAADRTAEVLARNWGFNQCKGLVHSFRAGEIVVQMSCDDAASLAVAVSKDLAGGEGVESVAVWVVGEQ